MFFVIGLGLILAAILGFGLFTRNWPRYNECEYWQQIVIFWLAMALVAGTGCFVYSLAKLFSQFVGYLWVALP